MNTESDSIEIEINDTQNYVRVDHAWLEGLARRTLRDQGIERAAVSIALVDDAMIEEVNRFHLGHDWPTDVVTFRLSDSDDPVLSAELVISAQMARLTALIAGIEVEAELALYVVHGLLHLCGYDDSTAKGAAEMRRQEAEALRRKGLTHTFMAGLRARADVSAPAPEVLT